MHQREYWPGAVGRVASWEMKRSFYLPLVVLALAALPVLAALASHRKQARQAEALLFERSTEVVAGHLRLLTSRQLSWQNGLRARLSNRPDALPALLEDDTAPNSRLNLPENCRAVGYGALENGRVVLRWRRVKAGAAMGALGDDLLTLPELAALLRAVMEKPAQTASVQSGSELLTAMTVSDSSPHNPRGWLVARWSLDAMCADSQIRLVSADHTLTARPLDAAPAPTERVVEINESEVQWRAAIGKGAEFAALFPRVSEQAIALTGGVCALLLALVAGVATRAAGLRAALAAERELVGMKDHLLHSVSHEFRTPLSVILSSAELLESYGDRLPPERRAKALAQIRHSTERMNEMVGQVLLLSRIEAQRLPLEPKLLDVAAFSRELARETDARIEVTAPERLDTTHDATLLRAVLGNLLSNAVKFSRAGQPVQFEVTSCERLQFIIRDTGPGIASDDLPRVREPFFRAASAADTPGTGLGLTIAEKCAALLGGRLAIESSPGGTTVTLTLPSA